MTALDAVGDVLRVVLGAAFLWYGYFDLRPSPDRKAEFQRWGFAAWVQPMGGALQLLAVVLLIPPATVVFGAALILAMMVFSVYVHLVREFRPRLVLVPFVFAALALVTAFLYGSAAFGPFGTLFRAWFGSVGAP